MLHDGPFSALGVLQPDPRVSETAIAARAATSATVASAVAAAAEPTAAVAAALTATALDATAFSTTTVAPTPPTAAVIAADTASIYAHRHIGQRKLTGPHVGAVDSDSSQRAPRRCRRAACAVLPSHVARPCQPPHLARPCQLGPADDFPPGKSVGGEPNGRLGIPAGPILATVVRKIV